MGADDGRREAVRRIVEAMAARGWNVSDLARQADVDAGTAGDLLNGTRWPRRATQNKIEAALGWKPGAIYRWEHQLDESDEQPVEDDTVGTQDHDAGVLLSLPPEALEGLGPAEREEIIAAARLTALERAREIRRRLDQ